MNAEKITDAELEVLKVLWLREPLTANQIVEEVSKQKDWNAKTIPYVNPPLRGKAGRDS